MSAYVAALLATCLLGTGLAHAAPPPAPMPDESSLHILALGDAVSLYREAVIIYRLGAFDGDNSELEELMPHIGPVGLTGDEDRNDLMQNLRVIDLDLAHDLVMYLGLTPGADPGTIALLQESTPQELDDLQIRSIAPRSSAAYVAAIGNLFYRNGRNARTADEERTIDQLGNDMADYLYLGVKPSLAWEDGAVETTPVETPGEVVDGPDEVVGDTGYRGEEPVEVVGESNAAGQVGDGETGTPFTPAPAGGGLATESATADVAPQAETTDEGTGDVADRNWLVVAGVSYPLALAVLLVWLRARRRRRHSAVPTRRAGIPDLLEVSRRLATETTVAGFERAAVGEAIRLVQADAGAFVRHVDGRLTLGHESTPGIMVAERLHDGISDRVVFTGQDVRDVCSHDPSIMSSPVATLSIPVVIDGRAIGALVVLRTAERPFDDHEAALLTGLKPILATAHHTASRAEAARADAHTDALTGVPNRRALDTVLGDDSRQLAVIMVDLDHFKAVNDTHGHSAGDDLLRAAADRLRHSFRPDDLICRFGGEEFVVVLTDTDESPAIDLAERARAALSDEPFVIGSARVSHRATASFGVAAGTGGWSLIERADAALYEAKRAGRNRVAHSNSPQPLPPPSPERADVGTGVTASPVA